MQRILFSLIHRGLLVLCLLAARSATAQTWDVSADFSSSTNPSGTWSYGSKEGTLNANLILFTDAATLPTYYNTQQLAGWTDHASGIVPYVAKNISAQDWGYNAPAGEGSYILHPQEFLLHPSSLSNRYSVVRWTAPATGRYTLTNIFRRFQDRVGYNSSYAVLRNNVEFPGGSGLLSDYNTPNSAANFHHPSLPLNAGDTLEFAVGSGTDGTSNNDGTTLYVSIRLIPDTSTIDVNSDGKPDLLWQNSAAPPDVSYWIMNGVQRIDYGYYATSIPEDWRIVGTPRIDTDDKHDLIWQNRTTGDVVYWMMNGTQRLSYGTIAQNIPPEWEIVATPDLNGDNRFDLLWRNRVTGAVAYWLMNGITRTSYDSLLLSSDTNWQIVATLDLTGDGHTDLLWQNVASGDVVYWVMNGTTWQSYATLAAGIPLARRIVGRADLNGDGQMDLLWRNQNTGDVVYWFMDGTTQTSYGTIATAVPLNWQIVGLR